MKPILEVIILVTTCGFPFPQSGIEKRNKISHNFSFTSYHYAKLQLSDKNISTHTGVQFKILLRSNPKQACVFFSLNTVLYKVETNQRASSMHVYVLTTSYKPSVCVSILNGLLHNKLLLSVVDLRVSMCQQLLTGSPLPQGPTKLGPPPKRKSRIRNLFKYLKAPVVR